MFEPRAAEDAPKDVVYLILGTLQFSDAALRVYAHPQLLSVAAAVNGNDFVPFNEAMFIKEPGRGASVAWHQDGLTHWNSSDWDQGSHGFNFMAQLYGCTPANGVWVVPGSHKLGKVDIRAMVADAGNGASAGRGADRVQPGRRGDHQSPGGARLLRQHQPGLAGDGQFRLPPASSVLGVQGGGVHNAAAIYDADRIRQRAQMIGYGIDARRQRFRRKPPYSYAPHAADGETYRWNAAAKSTVKDYNLLDLSI